MIRMKLGQASDTSRYVLLILKITGYPLYSCWELILKYRVHCTVPCIILNLSANNNGLSNTKLVHAVIC